MGNNENSSQEAPNLNRNCDNTTTATTPTSPTLAPDVIDGIMENVQKKSQSSGVHNNNSSEVGGGGGIFQQESYPYPMDLCPSTSKPSKPSGSMQMQSILTNMRMPTCSDTCSSVTAYTSFQTSETTNAAAQTCSKQGSPHFGAADTVPNLPQLLPPLASDVTVDGTVDAQQHGNQHLGNLPPQQNQQQTQFGSIAKTLQWVASLGNQKGCSGGQSQGDFQCISQGGGQSPFVSTNFQCISGTVTPATQLQYATPIQTPMATPLQSLPAQPSITISIEPATSTTDASATAYNNSINGTQNNQNNMQQLQEVQNSYENVQNFSSGQFFMPVQNELVQQNFQQNEQNTQNGTENTQNVQAWQ